MEAEYGTVRTCPRGTAWCTDHTTDDTDQCVGGVIDVAPGCSVWLMQEIPGIEPVVVLDTAPRGADLSILEAGALKDALHEARQAAIIGRRVEW